MKVLILKKPESAVTHYRSAGVWGPLSRQFPDVQIALTDAKLLTPDVASCYDWIFAHRPGTEADVNAIYLVKRNGGRVWIDLDDLVWQIPASNPAGQFYGQRVHEYLFHAIDAADVVTCSTKFLAEQIEATFGKAAFVVRNAWNDYMLKQQPATAKEEQVRILWRGSNTHDGDLMAFRDVFRDYPNVAWIFMGSNPWFLSKQHGGHLEHINHIPWDANILNYYDTLGQVKPHYVIVPLEDNPFNRAKSDIAALEATLFGATPIVPRWPEWRDYTAMYNDAADLANIIPELIDTTNDIYEPAPITRRLSHVNQQRYAILTSK